MQNTISNFLIQDGVLPFNTPVSSAATPIINDLNIENIRSQIRQKNSTTPFFATSSNVLQTITDHDTFPYPRYYRGIAGLSEPIIAEREAGWRQRNDTCYQVNAPKAPNNYPNHCFQSACSTVYPCYPEYMTKYADKEAMDLFLNRTCLVEYR